MKHQIIRHVCGAMTFTFIATAPVQADTVRTVTVIGLVRCNDWAKDRTEALKPKNLWSDVAESSDMRWIMGYLSGMAMNLPSERNVLAGVNNDVVADWMDKFCKKHPNSDATDASQALFKILSKK